MNLLRLDLREVQTTIFAVWTLLFIALLAFWQLASPRIKRKVQPYAVSFAGLVVLLFAWLQGGQQGFFFALIPVAIIICLNITTVKTCQRCGTACRSTIILPVAKYCRRCGSELDAPGREAG